MREVGIELCKDVPEEAVASLQGSGVGMKFARAALVCGPRSADFDDFGSRHEIGEHLVPDGREASFQYRVRCVANPDPHDLRSVKIAASARSKIFVLCDDDGVVLCCPIPGGVIVRGTQANVAGGRRVVASCGEPVAHARREVDVDEELHSAGVRTGWSICAAA